VTARTGLHRSYCRRKHRRARRPRHGLGPPCPRCSRTSRSCRRGAVLQGCERAPRHLAIFHPLLARRAAPKRSARLASLPGSLDRSARQRSCTHRSRSPMGARLQPCARGTSWQSRKRQRRTGQTLQRSRRQGRHAALQSKAFEALMQRSASFLFPTAPGLRR